MTCAEIVMAYPGSRILSAQRNPDVPPSDDDPTMVPSLESIQAKGDAYFKAVGHKFLQYVGEGDPLNSSL
jgi:hypothetical protein